MPELPEVEVLRRRLIPACVGRRINEVVVKDGRVLSEVDSSELQACVENKSVVNILRHGKQLFFDLGSGLLTVHLGMTGELLIVQGCEELAPHARALFKMDDGSTLVYNDPRMFGRLGCTRSVKDFIMDRGLGPDALSLDEKEFSVCAKSHRRPIKAVLMDQHILAGVGNLYSDEALFQARINPTKVANKISSKGLRCLGREIKEVLLQSIYAETVFERLPKGYLLRCRRRGELCPRNNGVLTSIEIGGRTSVYCPTCQRN
ncbi:MAG: DNA-formamidopyrimidine glycosylase family protein [Methanomassiliicoccales archaeon]